jgi:hypothetical protein
MTTDNAAQPVNSDSFSLIWTLITRSIGLTAGLAVAMLIVVALLSQP